MSTRLSKLEFVERLGDAAFKALLEQAKVSVDIEGFVKLIDWTTPDLDGTSIDLEDPRVHKIHDLEPGLIAAGVVQAGWADAVLGTVPTPPAPPVSARVYKMPWGFMSKGVGEDAPDGFTQSWDIDGLYHQLIEAGADVSVDGSGRLTISKTVGQ